MKLRAAVLASSLVGLLAVEASVASAATLWVRTDGSDAVCNGTADADMSAAPDCAFASIGSGIAAAAVSDTVQLGPGTFVENVIVTKALTLRGSGSTGASATTLVPAVSGPTCADPTSTDSLCPGGSNVILVQASDVTIRDLVVDGDNPGLTSSVISDGADLDARNGIIEAYPPIYHRLHVTGVRVQNIYLRGIYASSGGEGYSFTNNTVTNVKADPTGNSVCIFAFEAGGSGAGRGTVTGNTVSACSIAIGSNWSHGADFTSNTVTQSGSGVQVDNARAANLVESNTISGGVVYPGVSGLDGSSGIHVFAAYAPQTIRLNDVSDVDAGIVVSGQRPASAPLVERNTLSLAGRAGSMGVALSTTLFGYGSDSTRAEVTSNTITGAAEAIHVEAEAGFSANLLATRNTLVGNGIGIATSSDVAMTGTYVLEAHGNRIVGNTTGIRNDTPATFDATNNWWGCNYGPATNGVGCPASPNGKAGTVTTSPWLVLGFSGPPPFPSPATDSPVGSTLRVNSESTDVGASGTVADGTAVAFTASIGTIPSPVNSAAGLASTTFSAPATPGLGTVSTILDGQTLSSSILVADPASADVRTTLTGSTTTRVGETLTYTVGVSNHGPATASGVILTFVVPAGVSLVSATGDCSALPCNLGDLAAGASRGATVTFAVSATYSGPSPFAVTADAHATNADPLPDDNAATVVVSFFPDTTGADYYTVTPCRVLDTRSDAAGGGALASAVARTLVVTGSCGVPISARAVALNVTITQPTTAGHLTIFPAGSPVPEVSNINFATGATRANNAVVVLGSLGDVTALSSQTCSCGTVHLILDVVGYFE